MSFQHIKGQDKPIRLLQRCLEQSSLEGGYLFSGPDGIGKRLAALETAKALNCDQRSAEACGQCPACRRIEAQQHPDVHTIASGESEIKIEAIRQLKNQIGLKAYEGRHKVFIIDNAHRLTPEASNALLKVLEEPPSKSLLILISDKPARLFKTILSRCKTVKFFPLRREELQGLLREDYALDSESAHFLAYFCEGRLGECLRLKDTDIIQEKNRIIDALSGLEKSGLDSITIQD